jgi:hypothetical protein
MPKMSAIAVKAFMVKVVLAVLVALGNSVEWMIEVMADVEERVEFHIAL